MIFAWAAAKTQRWAWIIMNAIHFTAAAAPAPATPEVPASYNKSRNVLYVAVITCCRVIQPMATKRQPTLWMLNAHWMDHPSHCLVFPILFIRFCMCVCVSCPRVYTMWMNQRAWIEAPQLSSPLPICVFRINRHLITRLIGLNCAWIFWKMVSNQNNSRIQWLRK